MARIINAFTQFFDDNGDPLVNGWLKFNESGTNNTDKNTYADVNETIPNANPLQLDGAGRCPNVFGTGAYNVISFADDVVTPGQPGQQIQQFDPVGGLVGEGAFSVWLATEIYSIGDIVTGSDGLYYRSLTNDNENNEPASSPSQWEEVTLNRIWNATVTYTTGDSVYGSDGYLYYSVISSNLNNDPVTDTINWVTIKPASITYDSLSQDVKNIIRPHSFLINGGFDFWQRGDTGSKSIADAEYISADRWALWHNGSDAGTNSLSKQEFPLGQVDVPGNPKYFARITVGALGTGQTVVEIRQLIEGVQNYSGERITVSFYAKLNAGTIDSLRLLTRQSFGTGGTPSALNQNTGETQATLTGGWQLYSISVDIDSIVGKQLGTNGDDSIGIQIRAASPSIGAEIDISNVSINIGDIATEFEPIPTAIEFEQCQRFYQTGSFFHRDDASIPASYEAGSSSDFKTTMRATPTGNITADNSVGLVGATTIFGITNSSINFVATFPAAQTIAYIDVNYEVDAEME